MGAGVSLIVASWDAEGNAAAAEPAADEAEDEAENPTEGTLVLLNMGHAGVTAVLAGDGAGHLGPVTSGVLLTSGVDDHLLLHGHTGLHLHARLLHHWLLLHAGLLHHRLLLHHGLLLHAWLLLHWLSSGLALNKRSSFSYLTVCHSIVF